MLALIHMNLLTGCTSKCQNVDEHLFIIKSEKGNFCLALDTSFFKDPYELLVKHDSLILYTPKFKNTLDLNIHEKNEYFELNVECIYYNDSINFDYRNASYLIEKYFFVNRYYENYGKYKVVDSLYYTIIDKHKNGYLIYSYGDAISHYKHNKVDIDFISQINAHIMINVNFQMFKSRFQEGDSIRIIQILESIKVLEGECTQCD